MQKQNQELLAVALSLPELVSLVAETPVEVRLCQDRDKTPYGCYHWRPGLIPEIRICGWLVENEPMQAIRVMVHLVKWHNSYPEFDDDYYRDYEHFHWAYPSRAKAGDYDMAFSLADEPDL